MENHFQRKTRQREVILEELRSVHHHPTASELFEVVRRRLPRISLGTVYRNLDLLVSHGLVQKLESGRGQARFDGDPDRHFHVRCVQCGRVADVSQAPLTQDLDTGERIEGYEILGFRVEYVGVCETCGTRVPPGERRRLRREWR